MEPKVILVDWEDRPIGEMEKTPAHAAPHLHRAFSVFLFHEDKVLLQKRADHKYHCGGLWTNTCCSHPAPGETILSAAERRLREELGIGGCVLREVQTFTYYYPFSYGVYEYELDHVLVGEYDGPCEVNPEEVSEVKWVYIDDLEKEALAHPERFTPWFLICASEVIRRRRKQL